MSSNSFCGWSSYAVNLLITQQRVGRVLSKTGMTQPDASRLAVPTTTLCSMPSLNLREGRIKPRPHQRQCRRNRRNCRRNRRHYRRVAGFVDNVERNFVLATMSQQIEHVQFGATLSHERATNCCRVSVYLFTAMS